MDPPLTPTDSDVIVVQGRSPRRYALRRFDGEDQLVYERRDAATAQAVSFAEETSVNVWYSPDGIRFELVNVFRELPSRRDDHALVLVALGTPA